jgi:hypothetical protein
MSPWIADAWIAVEVPDIRFSNERSVSSRIAASRRQALGPIPAA